MKKYLLALAMLFGLAAPVHAGVPCSVPFQLQNATIADATQVMANYNAILACLASGAAASGANSDITSLSGLTVPITPAQGGAATICGVGGFTAVNTAGHTSNQLTLTYQQAVATTNVGQVQWSAGQTLTLNFASVGANGLDTGAISSNQFYYLWLIGQGPSTTMAALASLSSTAPTLPVGYTYSCRIGVWPTGSTSQLIMGQLNGKRFNIAQRSRGTSSNITLGMGSNSIIGNCSTNTLVLTTFSGIPPTAVEAWGYIFTTNVSSGIVASSYLPPDNSWFSAGTTNDALAYGWISSSNAGIDIESRFLVTLTTPQKFYVCNESTLNGVVVGGWSDAVNAN